jgi:type I restriction enzyme S subunit
MTIAKYQDMKDSSVDWIGKVPKDWRLTPVRYLFEPTKRIVGDAAADFELLSLTRRGIIPRSQVEGGKNPANYDTYQIAKPNDLVMCLFDYDVTPRTVGYVKQEGMVTGAYTVLQPLKNTSSQFYYYFFLALDETKELLHLCTGLRNGLSSSTFYGLRVPAPDFDIQQKIADFLDAETAKIDNLIVRQERLLQLLEEKRRATITHAVTRGLRPGISFGYVRLKNIAHTIGRGASPDYDEDGEVLFINQACVYWGGLKLGAVKKARRESHQPGGRGSLMSNDILINSTGTGTLGRAAVFNHDDGYFADSHVTVLRPKADKVSPLYIRYLLESVYMQDMIYELCVSGSTNQIELSKERFSNLSVLMPNINSQKEIATQLSEEDEKLDTLKKKIQTQITLLRERRTSLISHAVTGKIKV